MRGFSKKSGENKLHHNLIANYIAAIVNVVMPVVMLPLYLRVLGLEQWGAIAVAFLTQSLLAIIDSGLAQAFTREFSAKSKELLILNKIYTTSTIINIGLVCISALGAWVFISIYDRIYPIEDQLKHDAWIYGVLIFSAASISTVSKSLLIAIDRQILVSVLGLISTISRHAIAFLALQYDDTVQTFFICHGVIFGLESLVRFLITHRILSPEKYIFDVATYNEIKAFLFGMVSSVILGALSFNLERLIVSSMVSLKEFGAYSIAVMLGTGVLQLVYPLTQALLPRLMNKNRIDSIRLIKNFSLFAVFALSLCWMLFLTYGHTILSLYIKSEEVLNTVFPLLTIYLVGSSLNFIWNIAQLIVMKEGSHKVVLKTNVINLIVVGMLTPILVNNFGLSSVAYVSVIANVVGVAIACRFAIASLRNA